MLGGLTMRKNYSSSSSSFLALSMIFLAHVGGNFLVALKRHGEGAARLGHGAQVGGVLEHFGLRHLGRHAAAWPSTWFMPMMRPRRLFMSPMMSPMYSSGTMHFHVHDGLQQHGAGLHAALLVGDAGSRLERHFGGVDRVVGAVVQLRVQADHRDSRPARRCWMFSRRPFSTDGMKLRGTTPPTTASSNSKSMPVIADGARTRSTRRRTGRGRRTASCGGPAR